MNDSIERIWRRVLLSIGVGRVTAATDTGSVQTLQVRLGAMEIKDNMPRLSEYGFSSNPPIGSDVAALFVAGERTNGIVIATGSQTYRMRGLTTGEVAISDDKGQSIYLSAAGIRIDAGGNTAQIVNAPGMTTDGNLTVAGNVTVGTGATGMFTTPTGLTVEVRDGIITNIF